MPQLQPECIREGQARAFRTWDSREELPLRGNASSSDAPEGDASQGQERASRRSGDPEASLPRQRERKGDAQRTSKESATADKLERQAKKLQREHLAAKTTLEEAAMT